MHERVNSRYGHAIPGHPWHGPDALLTASPEFARIWRGHPVSDAYSAPKRLRHPRLGLLELDSQALLDPVQSLTLLVYTAMPGSESHEKLQLLSTV